MRGHSLRLTRPLGMTLLTALVLLLVACTPSHPQSTFEAAGPVARMQLDLFIVIFWAAVVVFIAVEGILLYAAIRFRRKPGHGVPVQVHGNTPLEIAWTIAPAIVLAVIAVPTVRTIFSTANPPSSNPLQVKVVAHQWWWEFDYPDLKVITANELHIPVGTVVHLRMESKDVIHSFWVPKLAGKIDVIPTRANTMWLQADKPGTYFGQCAEFCGTAHAYMRFRVLAQPKDAFEAWVRGQKSPATPPTTEKAQEGSDLFATYKSPDKQQCVFCHTIEGMPIKGKVGPDLTHFGSRTTLAAGNLENTPESLAKWLRDPQAVKPGVLMPNMRLSEAQISALVAYLEGLK